MTHAGGRLRFPRELKSVLGREAKFSSHCLADRLGRSSRDTPGIQVSRNLSCHWELAQIYSLCR
jgi:hypothetical protein